MESGKGVLEMRVHEFMSHPVETAKPDDSLLSAARAMKERNVGCVVVIDGGEIKGILTDRDIVIRVVCPDLEPEEIRVEDVMTRQVVAIREDADIDFALNLMKNNRIRRLPVLNGSGQLIGIVSISDLARVIGRDTQNFLSTVSAHLPL